MRKITLPMVAIGFAVAPVLLAAPARAIPLQHTWVSSNGLDTNNCDRTAPCVTFAGAYGKTNPRGEITCVDSGDYHSNSTFIITGSITINCESAIGSNVGGMFINTAATDVVTLRGLDLDALNIAFGGGGMIGFT